MASNLITKHFPEMINKFNTFEKKDDISDAINQLFTELYKRNITSDDQIMDFNQDSPLFYIRNSKLLFRYSIDIDNNIQIYQTLLQLYQNVYSCR